MNATTLSAKASLIMLFSLVSVCIPALSYGAGLLSPRNSLLKTPDIQSHDVRVTIENGYAITEIDQVFFNPNAEDIEAIYTFPIPEKASVGEFTYWINDQPITGEVVEAAQARKIYETEKSLGNETALVEQKTYRAFETTVYPVRAQQEVRTRLVYIQPTHLDSAVGRYVYPLEKGGTDQMQESFWHFNSTVDERFSFHLTLRSGYPLQDLRLPQHPNAIINRINAQEWEVQLGTPNADHANSVEENSEQPPIISQRSVFNLDQDIVLYWRLVPDLPGSVDLVAYKDPASSQGTFMLTLTPGADLEPIRQGRDWIFVLDFSGSMSSKYATLVHGMERAMGKLHPDDRFRIVLFNQSAWEVTRGFVSVTHENVRSYSEKLLRQNPGGSTNLYAGLETGINALDSDRPSGLILITDGVANVGVTEKEKFLELVKDTDVRLYTMIMGNGANRPLLEGMTKVSEGFAMNISNGDDVYGKVLLAAGKLCHLALRDIQLGIQGVRTSNITPSKINSLYHGQQLTVMGKYYADSNGLQPAEMQLTGKIGDREVIYDARLSFPGSDLSHPELERLWAYATIEHLQAEMDYLGESSDRKQALIDVAIDNSLVTNHTSMIIVRDDRFQDYNLERRNQSRAAKEREARNERADQPVSNNQQQTGNGFSQPRAYPTNGGNSGGGSMSIEFLVLLLPLLMGLKRGRKNA
jgi:Ca-activated chloride channel family protein